MTRVAQDGERLDTIVFETYNTLDALPMVLEANPHLYSKIELSYGDEIELPAWEEPAVMKDEKSLWLETV